MDAIRNRVKPEPVDRFTALMETETQRLADMESAAAAAHAAQEGVACMAAIFRRRAFPASSQNSTQRSSTSVSASSTAPSRTALPATATFLALLCVRRQPQAAGNLTMRARD